MSGALRCRNLIRTGVPEKTPRLTGHKTRALFDRYDIVHESDLRAATAKLNALMSTSSGPTRKAIPASQRRGKPEEIGVKNPQYGPLAQW
jgi:hypothetical protein